jgi:CMP/dCMP kinase
MKHLKDNIQVAIDGPVAAGKGTCSKLLAEKLKLLYIDTGAMYRALTYFIKQKDINWEDEQSIAKALKNHKPQVSLYKPVEDKKDGRLITVLLNKEDISWKIRTEDISRGVSIITAYKAVRDYMVPQQQKIAKATSVVMEGRDITTRVLPDADLKIYLDASEDVRAERRYLQRLEKGELVNLEDIKKALQERDYRDTHRKLDPLTIASDAWHLDTTKLNISAVVEKITDRLVELKLIER